jgi:outer membrane protein assembly factor BamB
MPVRYALLCLFAFAATVQADNWERFRGPGGAGISSDKNIPLKFSTTENVRWKIKIDGTGHSSPIVWGDRLFLQAASPDANERFLLCIDAKTGGEVWKRSIPGAKVKFRYDSSAASATAATDGEAVYIPFWNGKDIILTAYNFKGDKLWDRNFGEFVSQHGAGASPIVYKNLLIFSLDKDAFRDTAKKTGPVPDPAHLYALDKKTGKTVWDVKRDANRACYSAPLILQNPGSPPELIITTTTAMTSYEPETGKVNWDWKWTGVKDPLRTINSTVYTNGLLFNCAGDGDGRRQMVAVAMNGQGKSAKPAKAWLDTDKAAFKKTPYVPCLLTRGEHVYWVGDYGHVACVEAKTGKRVWFEQIPDAKFYASPVLIDGKIYASSEAGDVYVFGADPSGFKVLSQNPLGETIRATPAVSNGTLYVRTQDYLFAIGK